MKILQYIMTRNRLSALMLTFISLSFLLGCQNDLNKEISTDSQTALTLELQALGLSGGGDDIAPREAKIDEVIALVFDSKSNFAYRAKCSTPIYNSKTGKYKISISLNASSNILEKYSVALLANPTQKYGNMEKMKGWSKEQMLSYFSFDSGIANSKYRWLDTKQSFPMYGEITNLHPKEGAQLSEKISMTRSLAKVNIHLNKNDINASDWKGNIIEGNAKDYTLREVYLYNTYSSGQIAPKAVYSDWNENISDIKEPTLPNLDDTEKFNELFVYNYEASKSTVTNPIYIAENNGGSISQPDNLTTFVVGLSKDGGEVKYYKLNLVEGTNVDQTPNIIRNHHYQALIQNVKGEGSSTPDEAYNGKDITNAALTVSPWITKTTDVELSGREQFKIDSRTIRFSQKGTQTVSFETNLADVKVNWEPSSKFYVKDTEPNTIIDNKYYIIKVVDKGNGKGVVSVEAKEEFVQTLNDVETPFNIHVGKMVIPMTIKQKTSNVNLTEKINLHPEIHGYYIKGKKVNTTFSYVEVKFPMQFSFKVDKERHNFNLEIGDEITFSTHDVLDVFGFQIEKAKVTFENIKTFPELKTDDNPSGKFFVVRVPAYGLVPPLIGQSLYKLNYVLEKEEANFIGKDNSYFRIDITDIEPDVLYASNVLVVGETFTFDPFWSSSLLVSYYSDVNLPRLFFSESVFGMTSSSKVKVEPFTYSLPDEKDVYPKNVTRVSSFREIGLPSILEEFDIIIYINSEVDDELLDANNVYVKTIIDLLKKKKIAFIQTPSKDTRLSRLSTGHYRDPFLTAMNNNKLVDVFQSPSANQGARAPELTKNNSLVQKPYNLDSGIAGRNQHNVFFPSRDGRAWFQDNIFANFRDCSYIGLASQLDESLMEVIAVHHIVKPEKNKPIVNYPVIIKSKKYNYLWIGSNYFFDDMALGVERSEGKYIPKQDSSNVYGDEGFWADISNTNTDNSKFIVNALYWAMKSMEEKGKL